MVTAIWSNGNDDDGNVDDGIAIDDEDNDGNGNNDDGKDDEDDGNGNNDDDGKDDEDDENNDDDGKDESCGLELIVVLVLATQSDSVLLIFGLTWK